MAEWKGKVTTLTSVKRKNLLLYLAFMALPIIAFLIFYVYANIESIIMVFQVYEDGDYVWNKSDLLINLRACINDLLHKVELQNIWKNSIIIYFTGLIVSTPFTMFFSYYIFRKFPCADLLKVIIYLPSIISGVALVMMFRNFVGTAIPELFGLDRGLLAAEDTMFGTLLFYGIWTGLGGNTLLYIGNMNQINDSLFEASELDGCGYGMQFVYLVIPAIWPMWSTFFYMGIMGIFFSGFDLFTFFERHAPASLYSLGYYNYLWLLEKGPAGYPYLSAMALLQTAVALPIVYTTRYIVEKVGPSDD